MADQPPASVAVVGFQSAGKSTYLGAFFIACEYGADDMSIATYGDGNREYLNGLADELASLTRLERTPQTEPGHIDLTLRLTADDEARRLVIPDLSGELLRESMNNRVLDPTLETLLMETDSILLFVRADRIVPVRRLADFAAAMKTAGEEISGEAAAEDRDSWSIELAPTQARLTDVVQEILELKEGADIRLGLVISAWDMRPTAGETPRQWVGRELPLVLQALDASGIVWEVFGVSAQGGDFGNDADRERLESTELAERAAVELADGNPAGIGARVRWALR
jgi:hypothetical protein